MLTWYIAIPAMALMAIICIGHMRWQDKDQEAEKKLLCGTIDDLEAKIKNADDGFTETLQAKQKEIDGLTAQCENLTTVNNVQYDRIRNMEAEHAKSLGNVVKLMNSVQMSMFGRCEIGTVKTEFNELYAQYFMYCYDTNQTPESKATFAVIMRNIPGVTVKKVKQGGKNVTYYNIAVKGGAENGKM